MNWTVERVENYTGMVYDGIDDAVKIVGGLGLE